jgi:hypothetical protein
MAKRSPIYQFFTRRVKCTKCGTVDQIQNMYDKTGFENSTRDENLVCVNCFVPTERHAG